MCYALAHETLAHDISFVYFSLFDPKKVHFEAKIDSFLSFISINFLDDKPTQKRWILWQNRRNFQYCPNGPNGPDSKSTLLI